MISILLYVSIFFVLSGFILYFLLIMICRTKNIIDNNGFDITKDIISEYNSINIIESKNYFTVYNIKRKVIKLASKCYYGKDLSSISLSLMEAGISVIDDNKNKYINMFRKIFSNLKLLYVFPMISLFINNSSYYVSDAKVSIIFILIFLFITYILLDIKNQSCIWIDGNIKKIKNITENNRLKIVSFINKLLWCDKLILFGQLIMIVRLILIMFEIK